MQAPPSVAHQLHWIPVPPSWIVAAGLVILAVLPHQIPAAGRHVLRNPVGALIWVAGAVWLFRRRSPVLAMAALMFLTGLWLMPTREGFVAEILNKDKVRARARVWKGEEILSEDPHGVQERTENPQINYDEVTAEESRPWFVEKTLGENPVAIQDRPVPTTYYDADDQPSVGGRA
jgi:hypothetical protein